ncbi:MAG TPA: hypothetical protein ENN09_04130 [Planctomycetes bacterium]|mgnify:CR=1 FL=1|nr:hypothetical protein [Planctomycetota bacterium]
MSFEDGWAAINLEAPPRVPRTEYSAEGHYPLISAVTGMPVRHDSPPDEKRRAQLAFLKAWNYDLRWSVLITGEEFGEHRTLMGHAVYADGGTDYSSETSSPFQNPDEVLDFDPRETYGTKNHAELVRRFEEHYRNNCAYYGDCVNMTGIYITCISGLIDIFGWDLLLLAAGVDPERFGALTQRYTSWVQQYFDALADADVPVVMIHDDIVWTSGPFIRPDWYRKYVFPAYKKLFAPLVESGKRILYTSDGNYTEFIDDVAASGVHGFVMEPTTNLEYVTEKYGRTHVIIGNADTRILLSGTKAEIRAEVERCMSLGKPCPGFFMAVGNHIPPNTPVENAIYYNSVYEELGKR